VRILLADGAQCFQATHPWQAKVHHRDIGPVLPEEPYRVLTRPGLRDDPSIRTGMNMSNAHNQANLDILDNIILPLRFPRAS
jgi:hypothetical protein